MTDKEVIRDIRIVLEIKATEILQATGQMPVWYNDAFEWMDKQAQKPAENVNICDPDFIEKVRRLAEYLKNNPDEQKLQAEIHSWFENDKSQISMTKIWHKGDAFKDEKCMRLENWVIGNAENKRFVAGPVLEVTDGCIDIMDEDGSVAMVLRKEDTWAYLDDLLAIKEIPIFFSIISKKEKLDHPDVTKISDQVPVSDDLEKYIEERLKNIPAVMRSGFHQLCRTLIKDGANWQKQHGLLPVSDDLEKAAAEWDRNASFQPIHMIMDGDRPIGTERSITTHGDSFKAGAGWNTQMVIDKAIDFFEEFLTEKDCRFGSAEWKELKAKFESIDDFINAFKHYIKGE